MIGRLLTNLILALVVVAILINAWASSPVVSTEEGVNLFFFFSAITFVALIILVVVGSFVG